MEGKGGRRSLTLEDGILEYNKDKGTKEVRIDDGLPESLRLSCGNGEVRAEQKSNRYRLEQETRDRGQEVL